MKYASVVIDAKTGEIVQERHGTALRYPASLTKMMTLYLTFDAIKEGKLRLDQKVTASKRAAGQPPSKLWLKRGQRISVEQAILALVTQSANDAATVLAEAISGSEVKFAVKMTRTAHNMGMTKTQFRNASGLPNRRQRTNARDMALLARALIEHHPEFYPYFERKAFKFGKRTHRNHNSLLYSYKGTDGIKTGYINASGFNLVASVKRGRHHLIGVVFGGRSGKTRDAHMKKILNQAFAKVKKGKGRTSRFVAFTPMPTPRGGVQVANAFTPRLRQPNARPQFASQVLKPSIIVPAAKAATKAASKSSDPTKWAVQVGAYYSESQAVQRAQKAQRHLATRLEVETPYLTRGNKRLYRARLKGYNDSRKAKTACRILRRKGFDCLEIAPKRRQVAALN